MSAIDLITVGRANMDLYSRQIGADFEDVESFDAMVGGSPTNIAIGTARLGLRSVAFTGVGLDRVGDFVIRYLEDEKVITDHVARIDGKLTSLALLGVKPPSEFPLSFYREDPADIYLTVDHARALPLPETTAVLLSGNALSRGSCAEATRWIAEEADRQGKVVFLDLDLRPTEWTDHREYGAAIRDILAHVDVVIGTEEEFHEALSDQPDQVMARGAELTEAQHNEIDAKLTALVAGGGPSLAVLKTGAAGVVLIEAAGRTPVSGYPVEVLNTVGAGDAFAGGLITKRLQGWDWPDAASFANACGAIVVTRHGCASAFPTEDEIVAFLAARS